MMDDSFKKNIIPEADLIANPECVFVGPNYRITVLTERLVRLEYNENGVFIDNATELVHKRNFKKPEFTKTEDNNYIVITTKYFQLQYTKGRPFVGPKIAPESNLRISLNNTEKVYYVNHPEARNFLGSNKVLTKKLEKGLYSTDGFASIDDGNSMLIDSNGYYMSDIPNRFDTYVFMYRRDFGFALKDYYELTGEAPMIPRYALGVWWNRDLPYNFYDTKELIKEFNHHNIPLSVLLLGDDWHQRKDENTRSGYSFNKELFNDPTRFLNYMHERGIYVGLSLNTYNGISSDEENYLEFKNHYNDSLSGNIPINALDSNFINAYFEYLIKPLISMGSDFFWLNNDTVNNQTKALTYYHFNYYKNYEDKRGLVLANNPGIAGHLYPIHYSGKTQVSWKTLAYLPFFNLTSSNIGLSWWSHDIGGYEGGTEDSELYIRYCQLGCFSPILRFSAKRGHYYKREPWRWDVKTLQIVRDYLSLRHRLIPYIYTEAYRYHNVGLPLCEPVYYVYPEIYDEPTYHNEYYFGSQMFIAPITKKKDPIMNRSVEKIYLPEGTWYDFKTGKKFPGNKRYVTFQNDEDFPVYVKAGGIIPLAINENINDTRSPEGLELHIFPGVNNTYNLYEDDGVSSMYEEGYYIITRIEYNYLPNNYTVIIRPVDGKSGIIPDKRSYKIRFRNTREADSVSAFIGDREILDIKTYEDENDFIVEIPSSSTTSQITINCRGKDIEIDAVRLINEEIDRIISDLKIETSVKEIISSIIFGHDEIRKKRIKIRKLKRLGLDPVFIKMFLKLLEYIEEL